MILTSNDERVAAGGCAGGEMDSECVSRSCDAGWGSVNAWPFCVVPADV